MEIPKNNKYGRAKLPGDALRSRTIGVRVNSAELADMRKKSAAVGLPLAQWLRQVGLTGLILRPLVPAVNRQAYAELARLAANLNQLTTAAHEARITISTALLEAIRREVQALRKELLGIHNDCKNCQR